MSILEALLLLILLIVISAFVSCSELTLASARKIKLQVMAKDGGDTRTLDVLNMQQQPDSFITIIQIGLSAVAILAGIVDEAAVRPYFGGLSTDTGSWGSTAASLLTFALVTGSFVLIAGLMPRRVAMTHPEAVAVHIVRPMMLLIFILKPFVWTFDRLANTIFKLFKISTIRQRQSTSGDIYAAVDAGAQAGVLKQQEHYLVENILDMQAHMVTSTMSTRKYIAYLDRNDDGDTMLEIMSEKPHSKFLVCGGDLERVIGYIESHTPLTLFLKEKNVHLTDKRVLRKTLFVPDMLSLYDILETFKTSGEDFVVIVNEYALVVGMVAPKNVMSVVMGELVNTEEEPQIVRRTKDAWLVDGMTLFAGVVRALDIEEFPNSENYETIAGFMMYSLRKIPKCTDFLVYAEYKFEIIDTEDLKIDRLLVTGQDNSSRTDGSDLLARA